MSLRNMFRDHGLPWSNKSKRISTAELENLLATAYEVIDRLNADVDRLNSEIEKGKDQLSAAAVALSQATDRIAQLEAEAAEVLKRLQALDDRTPEPTGGSMGGINE